MNPTAQRDHACKLAASDPKKALEEARLVSEPWFRAQALSWVARFTDGDAIGIAQEAANAAAECANDYQKSAVRAWEISALAERNFVEEARKSLGEALELGKGVNPPSSRSEALFLLLQAAFRVGREEAEGLFASLKELCPIDEHWRCKRNVRDGGKMISGEDEPRAFFSFLANCGIGSTTPDRQTVEVRSEITRHTSNEVDRSALDGRDTPQTDFFLVGEAFSIYRYLCSTLDCPARPPFLESHFV